ncbi:MAG: hypothetical protein WCK11_05610 [Candidatus Falkowbacteria bacterium]
MTQLLCTWKLVRFDPNDGEINGIKTVVEHYVCVHCGAKTKTGLEITPETKICDHQDRSKAIIKVRAPISLSTSTPIQPVKHQAVPKTPEKKVIPLPPPSNSFNRREKRALRAINTAANAGR